MVASTYTRDMRAPYTTPQGRVLNPGTYDRVIKDGNDSPKGSGDRQTPHAYSLTINSYNDPVFMYAPNNEELTPHYAFGYPGWAGTPWPTNLDNALLIQLREKILASDWNPAVAMGEARESLSMVAHRSSQLVKAFRAARKLDVYGVARALRCAVLDPRNKVRRDVSRFLRKTRGMTERQLEQLGYHLVRRKLGESLYLEYTYGWVPLMSDISSAMSAISMLEQRELTASVRVRKLLRPPLTPWGWQEPVTRFSKQMIHFIKSPGSGVFYKNIDPLETLWELVPFSFVVDWFLPVGDYLAAMASQRVIRNSGETWTTQVERISVRGLVNYHVPSKKTSVSPGYRYFLVAMTRSQTTITTKAPACRGWRAVLEYDRAVSAIALLLQVFRK